jgi:hypothetical protein
VTRWSRITGGWAVNLDGSDAALGFSLPRVEVRSTPSGFRSACFFADGRQTEWTQPYAGGAEATMQEALARAQRLLTPASKG